MLFGKTLLEFKLLGFKHIMLKYSGLKHVHVFRIAWNHAIPYILYLLCYILWFL